MYRFTSLHPLPAIGGDRRHSESMNTKMEKLATELNTFLEKAPQAVIAVEAQSAELR
jgi:hypothetical protein